MRIMHTDTIRGRSALLGVLLELDGVVKKQR